MTEHRSADERRREIAEALLLAVAEHGLERVTLRRVADAAGASVGLVQRYFASKDELLRFGIEHVYERTRARVTAVPIEHPLRGVVEQILTALLPLDEEREHECRVWLAFIEAAVSDSTKREVHVRATRELLDGLERALTAARCSGEVAPSVDPRQEALALAALVDGLTLNAVASAPLFDRDDVRGAVRTQLDRLFGGAR